MKKLISVLLSIIPVVCLSFAFSGCGKQQSNEKGEEIIGNFYNLFQAYDFGLLNEDDLKSIACRYYDGYVEVNPYEGMFKPNKELNEQEEKELKTAYLQKIVKRADGEIENVDIYNYYGTYNGNAVITMYSDYDSYSSIKATAFDEAEIGGVIFKNFWSNEILLFSDSEIPKVEVNGTYLFLSTAYYDGLLTTDDLKSISCANYEEMQVEYPQLEIENPYVGLYTAPAEELSSAFRNELRQAFLEQIIGTAENTILNVDIIRFYGFYNNCAVLSLNYKTSGWVWKAESEIGGVTFRDFPNRQILLYQNNK